MTTDLRRCAVTNMPSDTPHLLKLHSYFVEGLRDNSDEDIFNKPGQEKYHRAEVKYGTPSR